MVMHPAARMNERHGYRLWVKIVIIAALIFGAFVAGRVTAHADTGDDGDCGIVCTQSQIGEDPGTIAQQIHDGDSRISIWQSTRQVWDGLEGQ